MDILKSSWLLEAPHDYELKYYRMMALVERIKKMIESNNLHTSLLEVESELLSLRAIKNRRASIENKSRVITGIDVELMSLKYNNIAVDYNLDSMYNICDIAIVVLEDLFKIIKDKWRFIETHCYITEIPNVRDLNTKGFILYIDENSDISIKVYSYIEPVSFKINWNELILNEVETIDNSLKSISEFVIKKSDVDYNNRFFRFDIKFKRNVEPFNNIYMITVMKHMLFKHIRK